jgi:hypothetical protein
MLCRRQVLVRLERIAAIQPPWVVHTPTFNHPGRHVEKSVQRLDLDVQLLGNATLASTCRHCNIDPQRYFSQLLVNLPLTPISHF